MKRLLLVIAFIAPLSAHAVDAGWKAALASEKITPDTMMWMAGYASRSAPADGVGLDLFAKALVMEDGGGQRIAMVTMDLIGIPREVHLAAAAGVEKATGIPISRLVLNASHTHCGPELRVMRTGKTDEPDTRAKEAQDYSDRIVETIVRLVTRCVSELKPASVAYSQARCGFAMNRRTPHLGGFKNFPNPDGPVDHRVPVLKVASAEGDTIGLVFGYACHCTTLSYQKFNGDYAGFAQKYLEEKHPGATALFVNGCSGDQNPYPRREVGMESDHGKTLATAVEAALETKLKPLTGDLRAAYREIPLAYEAPPTREELEARLKGSDKWEVRRCEVLLETLDRGEALPTSYPYPVQVLRLGEDLTLVTLGGEVVVDYSLRLQKDIADPIVWVAGYSNDVMTYIPSLRVWKEGGYEGGEAMKYNFHPARWDPIVEEHVVKTVMELRSDIE